MTATVIREVFDRETHLQIRTFLQEIGPLIPKERDDLFSRRYAHNPGYFVDIHHQITDYASEIFGEKVKPSYCFLSQYDNRGICPIHVDRPQCRYTIDYLVDQNGKGPWPIYVSGCITDETRQRILDMGLDPAPTEGEAFDTVYAEGSDWVGYDLRPNDALCYSGTHSIHYRNRIPIEAATLVFWHFVPVAYDGDLS